MKQKSHHLSTGKLRGLFCIGLSAILAAGIALNGAAANTEPVQYDVKVCGSFTHTAALSEGNLYLWGTNGNGQFPNTSSSEVAVAPDPYQVQTGVADAAVSLDRTLTVSNSGELRSYGIDPITGEAAPRTGTLIAKNAVQVAASDTFAAYVDKNGALYTWGRNFSGQLGNGSEEDSATPVQVFDSGVQKVSLGNDFALALMEDGTVYGWGKDSSLQLNYKEGGEPVLSVKEPIKITDNVTDIDTGFSHSCFLKKNGTVWTCGDNTYSQAGTGKEDAYSGLTQVLSGIRSISAGSFHNFAIGSDGSVFTWGYGQSGQLGEGSSFRQNLPVISKFDYVQVFACDDNTFAITSDGQIYSFGNNTNYLLAKSDASDSMLPERVLNIADGDVDWVYEEPSNGADDTDDSTNDTDTPSTLPNGPDASGTEPVEPKEPEIVSTPFVSGYEDGTFRPSRNVTRAEFVRMLVSALDEEFDPEANYGTCSFSDVPLNKWYEKYVAYAEQKGFVGGYSDGTFRPDSPITRAEACVMVSQMFDGIPAEAADAGFTDLDPNSAMTKHINYLAESGIVSGDGNGKFRPKANISRAEAVTMVAAATGFQPTSSEKTNFAASFTTSPFEDVSTSVWYYVSVLRAVGYVK